MADPTLALLQHELRTADVPTLWLADENIEAAQFSANPAVTVVGNRFDLIRTLAQQGWQAQFSDFDLSAYADGQFQHIVYRISKEKAVVHHLINAAARLLPPGARLILIGDKGEGIKTYARKAQEVLGGERTEQKQGSIWRCELSRGQTTGTPLDDQQYRQLRPIAELNGRTLASKPGLFGWNKIDRGSAFLIEELPAMLGHSLPLQGRVLDLGCGFGYLSLGTAGPATELVCTDNNAAALQVCAYNLQQAGLSAQVQASDAGDTLQGTFDLILCNPPFHAGFDTEHDLTDRFLAATQRLLATNGTACFVVNQHIPLERKARGRFAQIECHADNGHFKLVRLQRPLTNRE